MLKLLLRKYSLVDNDESNVKWFACQIMVRQCRLTSQFHLPRMSRSHTFLSANYHVPFHMQITCQNATYRLLNFLLSFDCKLVSTRHETLAGLCSAWNDEQSSSERLKFNPRIYLILSINKALFKWLFLFLFQWVN